MFKKVRYVQDPENNSDNNWGWDKIINIGKNTIPTQYIAFDFITNITARLQYE